MRFKTFMEMTPAHDQFRTSLYQISQEVRATSQKILNSPKVTRDLYTLAELARKASQFAGEAPRHDQAQAQKFALVDSDHNGSVSNWLLGVMKELRSVLWDIEQNPQRYAEMSGRRTRMTSGYYNTHEVEPAVGGDSDLKEIHDDLMSSLESLDRYEIEHRSLSRAKPANADEYTKWFQANRQMRQPQQQAPQPQQQAPQPAPTAQEPYQFSAPLLEPQAPPAQGQKPGWKGWFGK